MSVLVESIVVGTIVGVIVGRFNSINLPAVCKKWNKNHIMEICLFLTGFVAHLLCEFLGVNKWYCKNGNACKRR